MIDLKPLIKWNKLTFLIRPGKRLSQRVIFAGAWMVTVRATARGLGIIRIIVLARILMPQAFGLVAIALMTIELVNQLTATGFNIALIQRKGDIKDYLDTVWTMLVLRGLVLGGIIFGAAPLVASIFNAPDSVLFIQAMAVLLVIRGFSNSGIIYFTKELEVHKRFILEITGVLAEIIVAIPAALALRNAWALVFGAIAGSITGVIASYILHPYRPHLKLDFKKAKELFGFGMWVLLSAIALYIFTRMDSLFVGRLLGVTALGLYTMAYTICRPFADEIGNLATYVAFPAYSKLQDNLPMLRQAFFAGIEAIQLVTFPLAAVIFVLAPDFIPMILGNQWAPLIPALRIIGIGVAIYSLQSIGGSLFWSVGKPHLKFVTLSVASIIMVALLIPLTEQYGLTGAAISVLIGNIGGLLFLFWAIKKIHKANLADLLRPSISPLVMSILLGITLFLIKHAIGQFGIGGLISLMCIAVVVYLASSLIIWRFFKAGPLQILTLLRSRN